MATYVVRFVDGTERSFVGTEAGYSNIRGKPGLQVWDGGNVVAQFERDQIAGWWDKAKISQDAEPVATRVPDYDPYERS